MPDLTTNNKSLIYQSWKPGVLVKSKTWTYVVTCEYSLTPREKTILFRDGFKKIRFTGKCIKYSQPNQEQKEIEQIVVKIGRPLEKFNQNQVAPQNQDMVRIFDFNVSMLTPGDVVLLTDIWLDRTNQNGYIQLLFENKFYYYGINRHNQPLDHIFKIL